MNNEEMKRLVTVRSHHKAILKKAQEWVAAERVKIYDLDLQIADLLKPCAEFLRENLPGWSVHAELDVCQAHLHMPAPTPSRYIDYDSTRKVWFLTDEKAEWKDVCLELTWDELKDGILQGAPFYSTPPHIRARAGR